MNKDDDYKLTKYKVFLETRNRYIEHQYDQAKIFDKNVFLLSSGIFGVSFSFITNIVKNPIESTNFIIVTAWGFIIVSITLSLIAYLVNYHGYKYEIENLDKAYKNTLDTTILKLNVMENPYTDKLEKLNIFVLLALILGLILLIVYVGKNM